MTLSVEQGEWHLEYCATSSDSHASVYLFKSGGPADSAVFKY